MRVKIIIMLNWNKKMFGGLNRSECFTSLLPKNCLYSSEHFIQLKFYPSIFVFIVCLEGRMISLKVWSPTDWRFVPPQSKPVTVNLLNYFLTIDSLSWRKFVLLSLNTEEVASDSKIFSSLNYLYFEIRRSSQLRTLLKRVVVRSSVLSCEDLLISSLHRSANMWNFHISKIFIYLYFVFENGEKFNMQSHVWRNTAKSIDKEVSITILTKLWVQLNVDHNHI